MWLINAKPPAALPPGKETGCPLYRRLGVPQGRSGRLRKISPPTGIRSPDRPALASLYTDWAIPARHNPTYDHLLCKTHSVFLELFSGSWVVQWFLSGSVVLEWFSGSWAVQWFLIGSVVLEWFSGSVLEWFIGSVVLEWFSGSVVLEWFNGSWVVQWFLSGSVVLEWFSGSWVVQWLLSGSVVLEWFLSGSKQTARHAESNRRILEHFLLWMRQKNCHWVMLRQRNVVIRLSRSVSCHMYCSNVWLNSAKNLGFRTGL